MAQRTRQTEQRYDYVTHRLIQRYTKAKRPPQFDYDGFWKWLSKRASTLSPSSWRQYRAALSYSLRNTAPPWFFEKLDTVKGGRRRRRHRQTTAHRPRDLPEADAASLIVACKEYPSKWGVTAGLWIAASLFTGLRPVEWWMAERHGDWLVVQNAKSSVTPDGTRQRAFATHRYLDLSHFAEADIAFIDYFLERVRECNYATAKHGVDYVIRQVRGKLRRDAAPRYTLYSARHRFISDAKSSGLHRNAIAAASGHLSNRTAGTHYGRRKAGGGGNKAGSRALPADADVHQVEALNSHRDGQAPETSPSPRA